MNFNAFVDIYHFVNYTFVWGAKTLPINDWANLAFFEAFNNLDYTPNAYLVNYKSLSIGD